MNEIRCIYPNGFSHTKQEEETWRVALERVKAVIKRLWEGIKEAVQRLVQFFAVTNVPDIKALLPKPPKPIRPHFTYDERKRNDRITIRSQVLDRRPRRIHLMIHKDRW